MSQNQSYFWQTTRHNVYLKKSAKWHILLALMIALTFSTVCADEFKPKIDDETGIMAELESNIAEQPILDKTDLSETQMKSNDENKDGKAKGNFVDAFTASISVILLTELGDKTFFIAAIMAMRHPRLIVFGGAIFALALMTVLSCVFGLAANFIPKVYTYYISTALFLIFGLKMLYDGYVMKPTDAQEELEEVQTDLRRREDELLRKVTRKNSNSDKEDTTEQALIHNSGKLRNVNTNATTATTCSSSNASQMQHRQRKQRTNTTTTTITTSNNNNNHNNNTNTSTNNTTNNSNNSKRNSCDKSGGSDDDYHAEHESEVFLKDGGRVVEQLKLSTFQSSPASIASTRTEQTICDSPRNNLTSNGKTAADDDSSSIAVSAGTTTAIAAGGGQAPLAGHDSLHSLTESNGSGMAANGVFKPRLDREVNAALVQDPESGTRRRNVQRKSATYFTMRIFAQAFTMTFLAEWGDRSQLTTIILAASKDVYGVITGGILGHCICTGLAVIGGRLVASKISVRTVTIVGGIVFIGFAVYALLMRPDDI